VPSYVAISVNEAVDQVAKDALTEEIGNHEPYPPQDLIKWMKKDESINRQKRWERGENEIKNRKTSVSWQNESRATHRHIIEKTEAPNCRFCDVRLTTDHILWHCSETRNKRDKYRIQCTI
jgi:hypothetical protein